MAGAPWRLWFRRVLQSLRGVHHARSCNRSSRPLPWVEQLEDRFVPAVLTVNSLADSTAAGTALTLREAVLLVDGTLGRTLTSQEQAQVSGTLGNNDTIQFNLPSGPQTIKLTGGPLDITNPESVVGPGAGVLTISGNNADRVFIVGTIFNQNLSLVASISGLTISNGVALTSPNNYGGGILNFGTLTVNNATFSGNSAGADGGGAIYNDGGLTVGNSTFTSDSVTNIGAGGGIQNASNGTAAINNSVFTGDTALEGSSGAGMANSGTMTVNGCSFTSNVSATDGGGIYNGETGTLTVANSTFTDNSGGSDGGAIDQDGIATVSNSTFSGNSAGSEGGVMDNKGTLLGFTNCTLIGNTAVSDGGGLKTSGPAAITNCTIIDNRATSGESGIFGGGICDVGAAATVFNTIVTGNFQGPSPSTTADDIAGTVDSSSSNNLIGTGGAGGLTNGVNNNQVGVTNPGLGTLANNGGPSQTIELLVGSPAIDSGNNAYVSAGETDGRGLTRIVNGTVDIGAVEDQVTVTAPANQNAAAGSPTSFNLGSFADADAAGPWTVTVNWGDGSAQTTFTASVQGSLGAITRSFQAAGNNTVTVTVMDSNHDVQTTSFRITTVSLVPHFLVSGPGQATAGSGLQFTVTALDQFNNLALGYGGTVTFRASDSVAVLPQNSPLISATGVFSATLKVAGNQTLTLVDSASNSITGASNGIMVSPAALARFSVNAPLGAAVGTGFLVTALAQDSFGNSVTAYAGTVAVTASDSAATVPAFVTCSSGLGVFSVTLKTTGNQTLTVSDTVKTNITGSAVISVQPLSGAPFVESTNRTTPAGPGANTNTVSYTVTFSQQVTGVDSSDFQLAVTGTVAGTVSQVTSLTGSTYTVTVSGITGVGSLGLNFVDNGSVRNLAGQPLRSPNAPGVFNKVQTATTDDGAFAAASGDVNADGNADLVIANEVDDAVIVLMGNGNGTFQQQQAFAAGSFPASVALGDVNGDGKPDLLVANAGSNNVSVLLGNGNGTFQVQHTFSVGDEPTSVALGDVNGDGKPDIVVANAADNTVGVLLGNGNGTFQAQRTFASGSDPKSVVLGDVNANGKLDLAVVNELGGAVSVLLGNGNGTFQAQRTFGTGSGPSSATLAYLNGDSKLDLAVTNANDNTVSVMLGNGNGTFQAQQKFASGSLPFSIAAGDFNSDGKNDLAVINGNSNTLSLLLGNGNGTFQAQQTTGTGLNPISVIPADLNGDGKPDIAVANQDSNAVSILLNAGTDNFTGQVYTIVQPPATHFVLTNLPASLTAGNFFVVEVTALDQFNNTATGYGGNVRFTSSDTQVPPSTGTLTSGVGFFAATFKTAGDQTLFATDTTSSSVTGTSSAVLVNATNAARLVVTVAAPPSYPGVPSAYSASQVPAPTASFFTRGTPIAFTVTAVDMYGNVQPNYSGTVSFTASDSATGVVLPAKTTFVGGMGVFSATLQTAGNQHITATDVASASISGASGAITIRGLVVTSFTPTPSGFSVTFDEPFNPNTVLMYTPPNPPAGGGGPDDIVLAWTGAQISVRGSLVFNSTDTGFTFVKTDSISAFGTFNPASGLLAAGLYTVTLRGLSAGNGFEDALGAPLDGTDTGSAVNYQLTFSVSAPPVAVGLPDFARGPSNTDALYLAPGLTNGSTFALSYTNPSVTPSTGTATITFSTDASVLQANIQAALTSGGLAGQIGVNSSAQNTPNSAVIVTNDVATGANVLVTFQSALASATSQVLSSPTPGVSITPASINVANDMPGNGIPIEISSGLGVTSASLILQYNPSLLTISGAVSKIAGATFTYYTTIQSATLATAVLSFSSPAPISSTATPMTLGSLLSTVPMTATSNYGAMQLLHLGGITLNGTAGPISATGVDAVQVAAYFGDVTDNGSPLSLADAIAIAAESATLPNTVTQTLPGFAAFPNLDPAIIGDVSLQGNVSSSDAGAMIQEVSGTPRITIPYAPIFAPGVPAPVMLVNRAIQLDIPTSGSASPSSATGANQSSSSVAAGLVDQVFAASQGSVQDFAVLQSRHNGNSTRRMAGNRIIDAALQEKNDWLTSPPDVIGDAAVTAQEGDEQTVATLFARKGYERRAR
jgi:hypothetical protein